MLIQLYRINALITELQVNSEDILGRLVGYYNFVVLGSFTKETEYTDNSSHVFYFLCQFNKIKGSMVILWLFNISAETA